MRVRGEWVNESCYLLSSSIPVSLVTLLALFIRSGLGVLAGGGGGSGEGQGSMGRGGEGGEVERR